MQPSMGDGVQHFGKIVTALTFGLALTPALAADGIKASGIATRTAPADIVSVGFQIAEPSPEPGQEKNASELSVLVKAFEVKGIKVLEASESRLPFINNANTAMVNSIGSESSRTKFTKHVLLKLTGFKRSEDVADVLDENGIRKDITYTFDSSKFDAIRADLQREAIAIAIAQAHGWAQDADVKTGKVIDLTVLPMIGHNYINHLVLRYSILQNMNQNSLPWNVDQNLIPPAKDGEPSLMRYTVIATVVLAAKPE
jgi:Protein of unknown function (DUF541)